MRVVFIVAVVFGLMFSQEAMGQQCVGCTPKFLGRDCPVVLPGTFPACQWNDVIYKYCCVPYYNPTKPPTDICVSHFDCVSFTNCPDGYTPTCTYYPDTYPETTYCLCVLVVPPASGTSLSPNVVDHGRRY